MQRDPLAAMRPPLVPPMCPFWQRTPKHASTSTGTSTIPTKAELSQPLQDTIWSVTPWAAQTGPHPMYLIGTAIRLVPFIMGSIISYGAYNYVGDVMSLSGGFCSISCSLLVPSLFYLLLYRYTQLSKKSLETGGISCFLCLHSPCLQKHFLVLYRVLHFLALGCIFCLA